MAFFHQKESKPTFFPRVQLSITFFSSNTSDRGCMQTLINCWRA